MALLVVVIVGSVALVIFMLWNYERQRTKNRDLLLTGIPIEATIVRLRPDAAEEALLYATMEIDLTTVPAGQPVPPASLEVQMFVPGIAQPSVQPGKTVKLRYDPRAPSRMVIDLSAMGFDRVQ